MDLFAEDLEKSVIPEFQANLTKIEEGIKEYRAGIEKLQMELKSTAQEKITEILHKLDVDEQKLKEIEKAQIGASKDLQNKLESNLEIAQQLKKTMGEMSLSSSTKKKEMKKKVEELKSFKSSINPENHLCWSPNWEWRVRKQIDVLDKPFIQAQVSVISSSESQGESHKPTLGHVTLLQEIKLKSSMNLAVVQSDDDSMWISKNKCQVVHLNSEGKTQAQYFTRKVDDWLEISEMQGLAVQKSGHLLTTDKNRKLVNQFDPKRQKSLDLIHCGDWIPTGGLGLTDDQIFVSLANDNGGKIGCYNYCGDLISSIEKSSTGKALFTHPWYLTVNKNMNLCVSDKSKKCVLVVSVSGVLVNTYPSQRDFVPYGIATDKFNRILVADCDNSIIHILSEDCGLLMLIQSKGLGLSKPRSLCVDCEGHLWVGDGEKEVLKRLQYCN